MIFYAEPDNEYILNEIMEKRVSRQRNRQCKNVWISLIVLRAYKKRFSNSDSKEEFGSKKQWRFVQHLRQNHEKQKISNGIWNNWISLLSHLVSISFLLWICSTSNYQGWILKYNEIGSVFVEFRFSIIQHWIYINFHFVPNFSYNLLQSLFSCSLIMGI